MNRILKKLKGGDLRSLGRADSVAREIRSQQQFDDLFEGLFDQDEVIVMRSVDAVEKITREKPGFLKDHKRPLMDLLPGAKQKELKWHLSLLVPRLRLAPSEVGTAWGILTSWALDKTEGRIVRVNAVQGLFELLGKSPGLKRDFNLTLAELERQNIPSISARIRILRKKGKTP